MNKRKLLVYACFWLVLVQAGASTSGQTREPSKLAVDVIHLKNRQQIRGFVLSTNPTDELAMAVSCGWYEKEDRDGYRKALENAKQGAAKAKLQLRDRLKQALAQGGVQADGQAGIQKGALEFFLKKELERVDAEIQNPQDEDLQFLVLSIKSALVSSMSRANDSNRKIAVWSWHERLADVESRKPKSLHTELKLKKIESASIPPNLSNRFYATEESEDQWSARLAIVSYRLNKPIEFQGSGESMFLIGNGQSRDIASLMNQMMKSQMSSLLDELSGASKKLAASNLEDTAWLKNAMAQAERMDASYFRATHVRSDNAHDMAAVDSAFVVKLESGKWATTWRANAVQSAGEQKEDAISRVANDPQIKAIQTQLEAMVGSGGALDEAVRMGAATMAAQRIVNDEFQHFSEVYLNRLSGPPIQFGK